MSDHDPEASAEPAADARRDHPEGVVNGDAGTTRPTRFWHREAASAKRAARAIEHADLTEAQLMTRHMIAETRAELLGSESFVPVFILTVLVVIVSPLINGSSLGRLISLALIVATLLLALQRSLVHRRNLIRLTWVMGFAVALTGIATLLSRDGAPDWIIEALLSGVFVIVIAIALPAMLIRTLLHPVVSLNTLAGVMTAYLFVGLMFTGVFRFIDAVDDNTFFAQKEVIETGDFEYFSFITITTTGYGDLTPGNQTARTAAVAEAVTGQIFLVTVVARVVAMLGQQRSLAALRPRSDAHTGGEPPDDDPDDDAAPAGA